MSAIKLPALTAPSIPGKFLNQSHPNRWVLFGASQLMRTMFNRDLNRGSITRIAGRCYAQTDTNHQLHTGARCYVAVWPDNNSRQPAIDSTFHGMVTITVTGSNTLEYDQPTLTSGQVCPDGQNDSAGWLVHIDQQSVQSMWVYLNRDPRLNGGIRWVGAPCIGSTNSTDHLARFDDVLSLNPTGVWMNAGMDNDRLAGMTEQQTKDNLWTMIKALLDRGCTVVQQLAPPTIQAAVTPTDYAIGMRINRWLERLANVTPGLYVFSCSNPLIDRSTGFVKPGMNEIGGVHWNQNGAFLVGTQDTEVAMMAALSGRRRTPLIQSAADNQGANPYVANIYDGGWDAVGVVPTDSKATGKIDPCVSLVTSGSAGRAVACSLVPATNLADSQQDGILQRFVMTGVAGDQFLISAVGQTAAPMKSRLLPGTTYEVSLYYSLNVSGPGVVGGFECRAIATLNYGGTGAMSALVGTLGAAVTCQSVQTQAVIAQEALQVSLGGGIFTFRFKTPSTVTQVKDFQIAMPIQLAATGGCQLDFALLSVEAMDPTDMDLY